MHKLILSLLILFLPLSGFSINYQKSFSSFPKKIRPSLITQKRGVYLGYERGLYDVLEFGMEFQRKKLAIKKSNNHALAIGFNYNMRHNVLGYSATYWHLKGIYGLTYGGDVLFVTDFKNSDFGVAPVIGFRFSGFHLQTGYKFLVNGGSIAEANKFFIRLRFTLNKKTDRDLKW